MKMAMSMNGLRNQDFTMGYIVKIAAKQYACIVIRTIWNSMTVQVQNQRPYQRRSHPRHERRRIIEIYKRPVGNAEMCRILKTEPKFLTLDWLQQPAKGGHQMKCNDCGNLVWGNDEGDRLWLVQSTSVCPQTLN